MYPSVQVEEYPAEGGTLVVCHGGLAQKNPAAAPARLQPFSEAWASYALTKGTKGFSPLCSIKNFGCPAFHHQRGWFSGRIVPCHGTDPGSIPGSRSPFLRFTHDLALCQHVACCVTCLCLILRWQCRQRTRRRTAITSLQCPGRFASAALLVSG